MPEAEQAAAAVKMQSAQRGMAARRMSKELAASAVVKEAAIDLVVEKAEGVPLGLTLRNSPAQPGQPGPQEEGLVYVKEVTPYSPAADAGLAAGDIIVSVKGEAVVAHDRARDLVRASGTTVRLSVRKHAVDLDAIGGAFSTGVAWPQLDESSRALWTSLGWDAKSWARGPSPPTEDLEWKQLGDGERAAAEGLGYSEATWNDMKKWSFAFKAEAEEAKKRKEIAPRADGGPGEGGVVPRRDLRRRRRVLRRAQPEQAPRDGRHATTGSGQRRGRGDAEAGGIGRERRASWMMCACRLRISFH